MKRTKYFHITYKSNLTYICAVYPLKPLNNNVIIFVEKKVKS